MKTNRPDLTKLGQMPSEISVRESISEPGVYAVRLTGISQTDSRTKNNGEKSEVNNSESFVDANPQLKLEFTIVSGKYAGLKYSAFRQSIIGYVKLSDIDNNQRAEIDSYYQKYYNTKTLTIKDENDAYLCENIDQVRAYRTTLWEDKFGEYNEKTKEPEFIFESDNIITESVGWHRLLSVKNTKYCYNMLKEKLLPTGLLIDHGNNTYSIPETETFNKMCKEGKSRIFYIELYQDKQHLKLKRTFSANDIAAEANREEELPPETPAIKQRKIKA